MQNIELTQDTTFEKFLLGIDCKVLKRKFIMKVIEKNKEIASSSINMALMSGCSTAQLNQILQTIN